MKKSICNTFLVDGNSLFKSSFEATYNPKDSKQQVNGIYTFLMRVRNQLYTGNHNRLRIVFDGNHRGVLRRLIYPDYKSSRIKPNSTSFYTNKQISFNYQKERLQYYLDFFCYWYEDVKVEADDIIAHYVFNKLPSEKITIGTGDVDILQLIDEKVDVLYLNKSFSLKTDAVIKYEKIPLNKRKCLVINHRNFKRFFGFPHENIPVIKTICGDNSDDIKNIKGVKEITLFNCFPNIKEDKYSIDRILQECESGLLNKNTPKKQKKILQNILERKTDGIQGNKILETNERLVDLKNQEFLSTRCISNLQNNGFLSQDKYKAKDTVEMIKGMQEDEIYKTIIKNYNNLKSFFKPIKKTIE